MSLIWIGLKNIYKNNSGIEKRDMLWGHVSFFERIRELGIIGIKCMMILPRKKDSLNVHQAIPDYKNIIKDSV